MGPAPLSVARMVDEQPATDDDSPPRGSAFAGVNAGYTLVAAVLVGLGIGYAVDQAWQTAPWGMAGGALLFIVAGLYQVVKENWR